MLSISVDDNKTTSFKVRAKIYNNTENVVRLTELGVMARDFNFEIKDANGIVQPPSESVERLRNNPITLCYSVTLKPGDSCIYVLTLSNYYKLQPSQKYTVKIWRTVRTDDTKRETVNAESNLLGFSVVSSS